MAMSVSSGDQHGCLLGFGNGVKCWGSNGQGQLGRGSIGGADGTLQEVVGLESGVVAVSVGAYHSCALTASGGVKCWGANDALQLGRATAPSNADGTPQDVPGLTAGIVAISAGGSHTCAMSSNGAVKCWGQNASGQLGRGAVGPSSEVPQDVVGLSSGVIALSAGGSHTCAVTQNGTAKCWGSNVSGQLGRGSVGATYGLPQDVVGLALDVIGVSAGDAHTCALTGSGRLQCWGYNLNGELGRGFASGQFGTAQDVLGHTTGVQAVGAARSHTCALTDAGLPGGLVRCWGRNGVGVAPVSRTG